MRIVIAKTQKEIIDNFLVRGEVFIIEQKIEWEIEFDGKDEDSVLFTAYIDNNAVGAARLYNNKVGRVATLKKYRNQGIATFLMSAIEKYAADNSISMITLNAQLYIKDFYENLGYISEGEIFQEAEIDHVKMTKKVL